jgi:hypothetical protein
MTMDDDPYTGVRTRENIVAEPDEFDATVEALRELISQRPALSSYTTAETRAFEQNLVPAEGISQAETIARLRQTVADMQHDWETLNGFFNHTAQTRDWCSDYEDRLYNYNQSFKVLQMVGRPRNWVGSSSCWKGVDGSD